MTERKSTRQKPAEGMETMAAEASTDRIEEAIDTAMALSRAAYNSAIKFQFSPSEAVQFALAMYMRITGGVMK